MSDKMRIGDLAKRASVTTRTIRYYEELGLLRQSGSERGEGDFRYYSEEDLARLQRIDMLKQLGLSLEEISGVLELYFDKENILAGKQKILALLQTHLHETEEKIRALQQFRSELKENIVAVEQAIERSRYS